MSDPTREERIAKMSHMEAAEFHACTASEKQRYVEELTLRKIRAAVEADRRERPHVQCGNGHKTADIEQWGKDCRECKIAQLEAQLRETEQQVLASHQANLELEAKLRERAGSGE